MHGWIVKKHGCVQFYEVYKILTIYCAALNIKCCTCCKKVLKIEKMSKLGKIFWAVSGMLGLCYACLSCIITICVLFIPFTWWFFLQKVIKEGYLHKRGGRIPSWHKRWFILKGDILFYYRNPSVSICVVKAYLK